MMKRIETETRRMPASCHHIDRFVFGFEGEFVDSNCGLKLDPCSLPLSYHRALFYFWCDTGSFYVDQVGLELMILLSPGL